MDIFDKNLFFFKKIKIKFDLPVNCNDNLTLDKKYFFEEKLIDLIISYISVEVNYVTIYLPIEDTMYKKLNDELKNKFKNVEESEFIQGEYKYRSLKIILE